MNTKLAARARQLADEIWAEGKNYEQWSPETARELKKISGKIHDAASDLEKFNSP